MTKRLEWRIPTGHKFSRLYDLLKRMSDNPMVVLNHAIAEAMVHGPARGLELLRALDEDPRLWTSPPARGACALVGNGRRPRWRG